MSPTAVLTPFLRGAATREAPGSKLWMKRVLPVGTIRYKGRYLHFTKDYNDSLARAFADQAYDQVPFQLADAQNTHTNDPERFRGDIVSMDSRPDGLWVRLKPTTAGEKALEENPNLGVSVRIVENYDRADGKFYPQAVQHVLGTLDPRITGLGAWQAIEASNTPRDIIDLTGEQFTGQGSGGEMPELTDSQRRNLQTLLDIPPEEFDELIKGLTSPDFGAGDGQDGEDGTDDDLAAIIDSLTVEELEQLEAELEAETAATAGATGLSHEAVIAIEMANARAEQAQEAVREINRKLDQGDFTSERARLVRDLGIPPHLVDLAQPLLQGNGHVVELSNGNKVDAGQVVRRLLSAMGEMNMLGGVGIELGSPMDEPDEAARGQRAEARNEIVSRAKTQMGF